MGMGIKISHTRVSLTTEKGLKKTAQVACAKRLVQKEEGVVDIAIRHLSHGLSLFRSLGL